MNSSGNGKNYAGVTFIDFQKAFDILDYKILLDKMKCKEFSDKIIKLFHSYLKNRAFWNSSENFVSKERNGNCGVLQDPL